MVSRLVLFCDRCEENEKQVVASSEILGVERKWLEVHWCPECREFFNKGPHCDVVAFFLSHGEVVNERGMPAPDPDVLPCLWCEDTFATPAALDGHLRSHGFENNEAAWGDTCPMCGNGYNRLSMHTSRTHHRHVSVLFAESLSAGDPFHVVRDRQRAGRAGARR